MKPTQEPITGGEVIEGPRTPIQALVEFYNAFNNRDMALMSANWAHSDDIAMDNPLGGIKRGWDEIREVYERIFSGPAKVYVEFFDYTVHEYGDIFYAVGRERGEFRTGDTVVELKIRTSRIYGRMDGMWRQVHHHGSIEDPELLARYLSAVKGG